MLREIGSRCTAKRRFPEIEHWECSNSRKSWIDTKQKILHRIKVSYMNHYYLRRSKPLWSKVSYCNCCSAGFQSLCQRVTQSFAIQFQCWTSYVMWLFLYLLPSTKSTRFCLNIIFPHYWQKVFQGRLKCLRGPHLSSWPYFGELCCSQ